jgi:hypothetical protein
MTEQGEGGEERRDHREGLEPDPLAQRLPPEGAVILVGILGQGPTDEDWYLFLNRALTRRAVFKASDVLASEKIREEDPPFLGAQATRVYLRRGARVVYSTTQSREVQAEFLSGDIGAGVTAEPITARPPGARVTISPWACGSAVDACPSQLLCLPPLIDPSFGILECQSGFCPPQTRDELCVSGIVACTRFCGSRVDACESALGCSAVIACPR